MAALEEQRVHVTQWFDLRRFQVDRYAREPDGERFVLIRVWPERLADCGSAALDAYDQSSLDAGFVLEDQLGFVVRYPGTDHPSVPVDVALDALEEGLAHFFAVHAPADVRRDLEFRLARLEVDEEEVAAVVSGYLWIDLDCSDSLQGVFREDLLDILQRPVEGDGPSLAAGIRVGISFVDFEWDSSLGWSATGLHFI